jgi:hypothetical protein
MDDVAWHYLGEIPNNDIGDTDAPFYSVHGSVIIKGAFANEKLAKF